MLNLLKKVTVALEKENIEYMVSGSMALVTYTIPRMTRDIDIVVELKMADVDKFMAIFEHGYYAHRPAIEDAIRRQEMFNIIDFESGAKIDFMVRKNTEYRLNEFGRKIRSGSFGFEAWVVAIEDLILSKLVWIQDYQSERQMEDIKELMKNKQADKKYITDWCKKLNINTFDLL
jgi:hypothetical protein